MISFSFLDKLYFTLYVSTFYLNNSYLRDAPAGLSKEKNLLFFYIFLSISGPHIRFEKFVKGHITTFTEMLAHPI